MTEGCQPSNNPLPNPERGSFKASLGRKAERPPFAKWSSRSYDWNFLGEWLFFVPLGSRSHENSSSASGVTPKTYSQSQMTQERRCPCFPAASFSQQGAPERTWEAELSLPLMKQTVPARSAESVFTTERLLFHGLFVQLRCLVRSPIRGVGGRCPEGATGSPLPESRGRKSLDSS